MSRLEGFKKAKNKIKITTYSLILSLIVISTQGLETYALFNDAEEINNDLVISMGEVNIEIDNKESNVVSEFKGDSYTKSLNITNEGNLKQNIKMNLSKTLWEGAKDTNWIESYNIYFHSNNIKPIENMPYNTDIYLYNNDNNKLFELDPGDEPIKATIVIKTMKKTFNENQKNELSGKSIDLNLNICANQIGDNQGFYDIEVRKDTFKIRPTIFGVEFEDEFLELKEHIKINFVEYIDKPKKISIESKSGGFDKTGTVVNYNNGDNYLYIDANIYNSLGFPFSWHGVSANFNKGNHVILKFEYEDGSVRKFKFDFRYKSYNEKILEVQIEEIDTTGRTKVIQEIEVQIDLDMLEESNISSESELVEPPKEEIEIPYELDIVELPESEEVLLSSQTDIVIERKEETDIEE